MDIERPRIVVDTNVLIAGIRSPDGACRKFLRGILNGIATPVVSEPLFLEYEDVMSREQLFVSCPLSPHEREQLLDAFLACCLWTEVYFRWRPNLRDEGDNFLIELAVASSARSIISENKRDFQRSDLRFEEVQIWTALEFMEQSIWQL